mgnify:CR=1 FL=1
MDKYHKLDEDTIKFFNDIFNKKAFPINLAFEFYGNSKQKGLIKVAKLADHFEFILEKNLIVSINEELFDAFDDEAKTILFEQEIDKLSVDVEKGKIKMIKPDLTTFSGLINKWGIEKISRANQVDLLASEQKEDAESEFI